ncbi:MAG: hypothetical protein QY318_02345 [Candidatus Dojkabacteria bacterium]|nr:MAG: hypothetical protein QY318_02345 [Candidatus Dojkabacteria bacterium]
MTIFTGLNKNVSEKVGLVGREVFSQIGSDDYYRKGKINSNQGDWYFQYKAGRSAGKGIKLQRVVNDVPRLGAREITDRKELVFNTATGRVTMGTAQVYTRSSNGDREVHPRVYCLSLYEMDVCIGQYRCGFDSTEQEWAATLSDGSVSADDVRAVLLPFWDEHGWLVLVTPHMQEADQSIASLLKHEQYR